MDCWCYIESGTGDVVGSPKSLVCSKAKLVWLIPKLLPQQHANLFLLTLTGYSTLFDYHYMHMPWQCFLKSAMYRTCWWFSLVVVPIAFVAICLVITHFSLSHLFFFLSFFPFTSTFIDLLSHHNQILMWILMCMYN